ncbi:MAG: hypothetical protein A2146_01290 [Actinobacteria bacterium RBG_16_67_10]|nr:MAG: hypothetical protein A2146_01290 [Actinobacteria bacterium RBG_16_67_10]
MKRRITGMAALALLVAAFAFPASAAKMPNVFICHFAGHQAPASWTGADTTLDGDYVVAYREAGLGQDQVDYCLQHGGLGVIRVNANSLDGHGAQLLERVAAYPL